MPTMNDGFRKASEAFAAMAEPLQQVLGPWFCPAIPKHRRRAQKERTDG